MYVTQGQARPLPGAEAAPHGRLRAGAGAPVPGPPSGTLEELGLEKRYQLIVSTNFDTALEQAFDDEQEPYDLAVYMASGQDKGKFVHFPYEGTPEADRRSELVYGKFPIGEDYELERTLIVKIHGAVDGNIGDYRWKENYVITEDHYIDYLSRSPIESLVPVQILDKLRDSHCLFLGYTVRDWNLRVFLKRIWEGSARGQVVGGRARPGRSWRRTSGHSPTWISTRPTWRTT